MAKMEKLSVSLPADLVAEIRAAVPPGGISSFLAEATRRHLARWRFWHALERGFGAWPDGNHPELATPEDSSHFVRCLRQADFTRLAHVEG